MRTRPGIGWTALALGTTAGAAAGVLVAAWVLGLADHWLGQSFMVGSVVGAGVGASLLVPIHRRPRVWVGSIVVVGFLLGLGAVEVAPPGHRALARELARLQVPANFSAGPVRTDGNFLCFDVCRSASRSVCATAPIDDAELLRRFAAASGRRGYREVGRSSGMLVLRRGGYELDVAASDRRCVELTVTAPR